MSKRKSTKHCCFVLFCGAPRALLSERSYKHPPCSRRRNAGPHPAEAGCVARGLEGDAFARYARNLCRRPAVAEQINILVPHRVFNCSIIREAMLDSVDLASCDFSGSRNFYRTGKLGVSLTCDCPPSSSLFRRPECCSPSVRHYGQYRYHNVRCP